jgi:hypothetical protein
MKFIIWRPSVESPTGRLMPPPPGLAFGEPDDRLQRGIQYAEVLRFITDVSEYWIIRFHG